MEEEEEEEEDDDDDDDDDDEEEKTPGNLSRDSPSSGRVLTRDVHITERYSVESVGRHP